MRDDITPTNPQPTDLLGAQLDAFREDPADQDLFFDLRDALRKSGRPELLAELGELRAPHESDRLRAAEIWSEAGEARLAIGHDDLAERDLREALALDPANEGAGTRLTERLMLAERFADAAAVMEAELDELALRAHDGDRAADAHTPRRAARHRMLAQVWDERLGRLDRALHHWQRAWQLEPNQTEALDAARRIYASLGDEAMVARLYEAELEVLGDRGPPARRAELELELGRLMAKEGDGMAAAGHLEVALRLDPDGQVAREVLAEVYSSPAFAGKEDRQRRASELFVELGTRRLEAGEDEAAIRYLRRALGVDPYSAAATEALEQALERSSRWDELERLYHHRTGVVESAEERLTLVAKRALLYEQHLGERESLKQCFAELAAAHPIKSDYARRLREIYREDENWAELASLIEHEIAQLPEGAPELPDELLELATLAKEHLGERDRAAEFLHQILSIDPRHPEALARYGDHFRERRDWRGLADLTEFSIDNAIEGNASPAEIARQLEELAQICEVRLGDVDRAVQTWHRVQEIDPHNPKPREALRRLASRAKMWESLVGVLEQEAEAARTPNERAEALRRIAQTYRERQVNPRRAIALYEEVLTLFPHDEGVLKALVELYEREGDDAGVAHTIRRQLELDARKLAVDSEAQGIHAGPAREWPVAKRVERLTALRRLATMYEQRLADVEGVVFACSGVLEILPGDRDALDRMERVLEKAGDLPRLEQTLEYHVASATGPAERAKVLRRLARLAEQREDEVSAMERWEHVLKAAPNDPDGLEALAGLYERHERWGELALVLERTLLSQKPPPPASPAAAKRAAELKRYAAVVDDKLGDAARATRAWHKVLEVLPKDRDALDALVGLHEANGQWRDLAEILARQAPLYLEDDPDRAAEIALRRATLLEERLGAPVEAITSLESLLRDIDPANLDAHRALRRLYEARGDFEAAVRVAEREMYLTGDDEQRIARGLEIGLLCRDRLGDPTRALQAFERVLEITPDHDEALAAAGELYATVGNWRHFIQVLERRIEHTAEPREQRTLMIRIAEATADKLGHSREAFRWYRRAHERAPDATTIAELRRAAESYGLWRDLADVYEDERAALRHEGEPPVDASAYVAATRELAALAERRLNNRARAMEALLDALSVQPEGEDLLAEAERIALEANQAALWKLLLECLDQPLSVAGRAGRVGLHLRRARILEEHLDDARAAAEELLRAFAWGPDRDDTRRAVYDLAERAGGWNDVASVEAALLARAVRIDRQVEILRRIADLVESRLGEPVRAFRTHLRALLLAPEDSDTVAHLWRLARLIGTYEEADRTPSPEPPPAHVEVGDPAPARPAPDSEPVQVQASRPRREQTQELSLTDLMEGSDPGSRVSEDLPGPSRQDQTQELDLNDLVPASDAEEKNDPTIELRTEDLIQALGGRDAPATSPPRRADSPGPRRRRKGPPPPPPPPPRIAKRAPKQAPPAGRRPSAAHAAAQERRAPPALPVRAYASPWEEFASAYDVLPAQDDATRVRWMFRAAEVWETGAGDVGRAFDTLARALALAPHDTEPKARLHRLTEAHEAWDRLAGFYERLAEDADTAEKAAELLIEVAEVRERQGRTRDSESLYRRVLGMRPDSTSVRERLETLYRDEQRWVDLAASLEERTDPRLGAAAPAAERPALLRELAAIYQEKLSRPHDAIDALERLRKLAPEDVGVLHDIAELNSRLGRWSQVIATLTRLADVADGTSEAREALRRIARIYEGELELPDRAIDAYRQLVAQWPDDADAYAALDRLYEAHAKWADLADVLSRRSSLSRAPAERAELLQRRARILLEWLDAPEDAASALRHARTTKPDDGALAEELVQALTRAGRASEAAAVLEGRLGSLEDGGASAGDVAALLIRLASLRAEELADPDGARKALEDALERVPNHPTALATLARLAESQENPRAFAEAKLREAEAVKDVDHKVDALVAAGGALRDDCADIEGARAAFEQVLSLRPYHSEATWALAGLVEQGGNLESAAALLENKLEDDSIEGEERARLLTQLAALSRQAGMESEAERRLATALEIAPSHLPAVIARADLLESAGRHADLEAFLQQMIPDQGEDAPPHARAELRRRLAVAFEGQDRADEAYQTLLEADRLHRRSLPVKLALGENRYRARRWREASLHLGALADHPDAEQYPAEVAEGLYHAALAEIRSLRPEKAEPLYERALELKPNYAPALHALAELAMERGNAERAADLLTQQAEATDEPQERLRLFEALGDMALLTLRDEGRGKRCYEAAVAAADPLESRHMPLLEKLLERQDLAGDHGGSARTAELMASFAEAGAARASRLLLAAENYAAADEHRFARSAAERAVEAAPHDLDAVAVASELAATAGDHEITAAMLGRALSGADEPDEVTAPRHALLWYRLGEARLARGDRGGAATALERAVAVAPDADGAMSARRRLIELWDGDGARRAKIVDFLRDLAADSLEDRDIVRYARALCGEEDADGGRAMLELAAEQGHVLSDPDRAFLAAHPARTMAEDEAYQGSIEEEDRAELIADPEDAPLARVFAALWEAAPLLWSEAADALERSGITDAERVPAKKFNNPAAIFTRAAKALGAPATVLYATAAPAAPDVELVCVSPPIVVLGPRVQGLEGDRPRAAELRFILGRAAELSRPERIIAAGLPRAELADLLASLVRVFGDREAAPAERAGTSERDELLKTTLPVKLRQRIGEILAGATAADLDLDRYLEATHRAADRAGLLMCGDMSTAIAGVRARIGAKNSVRHLVETALSRLYLPVRARLGVGARG